MIVGSLAGPLVGGGGFCAGSEEIVHHQRISAAAYTFSAALPALLATTASETINILQQSPETVSQLREMTKAMRAQLDPRSDWVYCTSAVENPILILVLKPEVVASKKLSYADQQFVLQDVVDEVGCHLIHPDNDFTNLYLCSALPTAFLLAGSRPWETISSRSRLSPLV